MLLALVLLLGLGSLFAVSFVGSAARLERDRVTERALAQAKQALIAYASTRQLTVTSTASDGPGYLPCPDMNDDGVAEAACGNADGTTDQSLRLGRLPWKTLQLEDLRDGAGERLWYAVSSRYKNVTAQPGLNPETGLGTITLRTTSGAFLHNGSSTNLYNADTAGAVALVIAPGTPMTRWENASGSTTTAQDRSCGGAADCMAVLCPTPTTQPKCNPVNYLDKAAGATWADEDNAVFADINPPAVGNANGFVQGPVTAADGTPIVNDRIVPISYSDIMQPAMRRVASELKRCLLQFRNGPGAGRYPWPAPVCRSGYASGSLRWSDFDNIYFGRVPYPPFDSTLAAIGAGSDHFADSTCSISDTTTTPTSVAPWWVAWEQHVFYAIAYSRRPTSSSFTCGTTSDCLRIADVSGTPFAQGKEFVVIVGGPQLGTTAPAQTRVGSGTNSDQRAPRHFLERNNPGLEAMNSTAGPGECATEHSTYPRPAQCVPLSNCNTVTTSTRSSTYNDIVLFHPQ